VPDIPAGALRMQETAERSRIGSISNGYHARIGIIQMHLRTYKNNLQFAALQGFARCALGTDSGWTVELDQMTVCPRSKADDREREKAARTWKGRRRIGARTPLPITQETAKKRPSSLTGQH